MFHSFRVPRYFFPGDELYGYMTLAKDWKDGVLSIIMRGMSKNFSDQVRCLLKVTCVKHV